MSSKTKAIGYILCSAFCFALMSTFVRLAGDLPSIQKSFFRNIVSVVFASILLFKDRSNLVFRAKDLPYLFMRAFFGTLGVLCNFYAVDHMVLSDANMLNKLSPFFAIFCSYFLLKEKIKPFQLFGIGVAFVGALLIIKPGFSLGDSMLPSLLGVLGGMSAGIAYTFVRALGQRGVKGPFIVFFFSVFSCVVVLPFILLDYHPMTGYQLGMLCLAGFAASGGQFAITAAYTHAPAREISIYDYSQILFSALFGFIFFHQVPDVWSVLGYVVICGISVVMFFYNNRHEQPASK